MKYTRIRNFVELWKLKQFMGWINLDSSSAYVQGNWEENSREIFRL